VAHRRWDKWPISFRISIGRLLARYGIGGVFVTQIFLFFDEKTLDLYYEFEKIAYPS
jgi:hypothetical protein